MRKDKSILFSRIVMISLISIVILALNNLSIISLDKGIGIYGGLFHVTAFTQSFNIFILIITAIIIVFTSFYTRKVFIKEYSTISKLLYKFAYNKTSLTLCAIMEYYLTVVFIISGAVIFINTDIIMFTINITQSARIRACLLTNYFFALIDLICLITFLVIITYKVIKLIMLFINIIVKFVHSNIHLLFKTFIRFIILWLALNIFLELAVKYSTCSLISNLLKLFLNYMYIVLIVGSNILMLKRWKSIPYLVVKKNLNLTQICFIFSGIGCGYFFTNFVLTSKALMNILDMELPNFLYVGSPVDGSMPGGGIPNNGGGGAPNNGGGGNNVGLLNHNPEDRTRSRSSSTSTASSVYSSYVKPDDTQHIRNRKLGIFIFESYTYFKEERHSYKSFENSDLNPVAWGITSSEHHKRISREVEERLIHGAQARLEEVSKGKTIPYPYSFTLKDIGIDSKHPLFGSIKGILFPHISYNPENEVIYSPGLGVSALKALRNAK